MKSTLSFLTAVLIALLVAPRVTNAQYAWVPVVSTDPAPVANYGPADYGAIDGQVYDATAAYSTMFADYGGDALGCGCSSVTPDCGGSCGTGCDCPACRHGGLLRRSFGSLEYLQWYNKGRSLPALVTTSPNGTRKLQAGVLGLPTTSVLFGGNDVGGDLHAGGRLTFGWWLGDDYQTAIGAKVFGYEGDHIVYSATSTGDPILAQPFFNTLPIVNAQDARLVAFPGAATGTVSADAVNDMLGVELFARTLLDQGADYRLDLLAGYHFTRIDDNLLINSVINDGISTFDYSDYFDVDNQFHAGELGLLGEYYRGCWTITAMGKVSVGNMRQRVAISGRNIINGGAATPGGLYAQPTNIGSVGRNVTAWAPEASFKVSYAVSDRLSLSVGYTFLYLTRVALAGDNVDTNVNSSQFNGGVLGGPADPSFQFQDSDYWVQTIDIGLNWDY